MKYEHLIGRQYNFRTANCFHIVRDFYKDNFDLDIPNFACPPSWAREGNPMASNLYDKAGFRVVDVSIRELRPADLLLIGLGSPYPNHLLIMLGPNKVLHHAHQQISTVDTLKTDYRGSLLAVLRHPAIVLEEKPLPIVHAVDFLPLQLRQRIANDPNIRDAVDRARKAEAGEDQGTAE
jgi:NlpC/P60 family